MGLVYLDENMNNVKKKLVSIANNLQDVDELVVQTKGKDGSYSTLSSANMNSYKLMIHKSNLEHIAIHNMIKENFITPKD